jgi:hypothetical protein
MKTTVSLPFGRHQGKALAEVPADYLQWLLRSIKLSSGVRGAVAGELTRRGIQAPDPSPRPEPRCGRHPAAGFRCLWGEDTIARKFIRAECVRCRQSLGIMPKVEPYVSQADANASPAPVLDALLGAEAAGAEIISNGKTAWVSDYRKAPPEVRNAVRQCKAQLGRMIGNNTMEPQHG